MKWPTKRLKWPKNILKKIWRSRLCLWLKAHGSRLALGTAVVLIGLQAAVLVFNKVDPQRPILGLRLENVSVSHLNKGQLHGKVLAAIKANELRSITVKSGNYRVHVTPRQLGASHNSLQIEQNLISVGRTGSLWHRLVEQDSALFGQKAISLGFSKINKSLASAFLQQVSKQINVLPQDASFGYKNQQVVINPESAGAVVDVDKALAALQTLDSTQSTVLNLPIDHPAAAITFQELKPLVAEVQSIVSNPITVAAGSAQVQLDQSKIAELIEPVKQINPTSPGKQTVNVSFNDAKISAVLDSLAAQVAVPAKPKVVVGQTVLSAGVPGTQIDGTHAKVELIAGLEKRELASKKSASPASSTNQTPPSTSSTSSHSQPPPSQPGSTTTKTPASQATNPSATPDTGDTIVIPVEKLDPPVVNQGSSSNPLGRYPATINGKKMIYLTFDDGPGNYTEQILDILKQYNVHAIFFLIGKNAAAYPKTVQRIVAEGHTIGNHSYTHSDLAKLSQAAVDDELSKTQKTIQSIVNITPDLFRPPYGSIGPNVYNSLPKFNLNLMMWSIDPRDWAQPGSDVIVQRVISAAAPGGNILLHILHNQTVQALPAIIQGLRDKGYSLP